MASLPRAHLAAVPSATSAHGVADRFRNAYANTNITGLGAFATILSEMGNARVNPCCAIARPGRH